MMTQGNTGNRPPMVSVIIPTYNRGWILSEAIDSVLNQDYTHYELIVVDDGSTDQTTEILDSYGRKIISAHQENRGVSSARNHGIRLAKGKLIAFLDSDDLWLKGKLRKQVAFFNRQHGAVICQTEEIWIRNGVRINPKKRHQKPSGMIFEKCLELCLISPSAVMIRKDFLDKTGGFDESLPACEDYDLWLRISHANPVYLLNSPLVVKRGGHEDQLSRLPSLDKYRIRALEKIIHSGYLSPAQRESALRTLKAKGAVYAAGCLKRGRRQEADDIERLIRRCE